MNRLKREPVTAAVLVPIIVWLAAHFGFDVDEATATWIAGVVLAGLGILARQTVTPVADPHDNQGHQLVPLKPPPTTYQGGPVTGGPVG